MVTRTRIRCLASQPRTTAPRASTVREAGDYAVRGGIIDVEFIVQYLVLGHAHAHAELTGNIGNLALLKLAARLGLIEQDIAGAVQAAFDCGGPAVVEIPVTQDFPLPSKAPGGGAVH